MTTLTDPDNAEIVLARNSEKDIKMRGLEVFIDGEFAYDLMFNKSFAVELAPGRHTVKVSNHLFKKSMELDLKPGETINLQAGNNFGLIGGLMVSVLGMGPYKVFLKEDSAERRTA